MSYLFVKIEKIFPGDVVKMSQGILIVKFLKSFKMSC
jgi:hypothetical protein